MISIRTQKSFQEAMQKGIDEVVKEAVKEATKIAYQKGFEDGLRKGLMTDKEGVHINSTGLYHFKDGSAVDVVADKS